LDSGRIAHGEAMFRRWTLYGVKFGSETVFESTMQELTALYEKTA